MPDLRTLADVAAELHLAPRTLRELVNRKRVPALRAGRSILFDAVAYAALLEAIRLPSSDPSRTPARSDFGAPARRPDAGKGSAYDAVMALTARPARKTKLRRSKPASAGRHGPVVND